jgi:O-antigen/teichoic acid export membrane protein
MRAKNNIIKLMQCLSIILLYYMAGQKDMFLYMTTLSLYNIYVSSFSHITLENTFKKINSNYSKLKIFKYISIIITSVCLLFVIISILLSDTINIFLNIENTFLPSLLMSLTLITEPIIKIFLEYLESYNKPKISSRLLNLYYILETIFLILISLLTITILKLPMHISVSLLYLSKILSGIIITVIVLIILNKQNINFDKLPEDNNVNLKKETIEILKNNSHKSLIEVIKNGYYYISIIILYMVLSTRYNYNLVEVKNDMTFIYLYGLTILNFLVENIMSLTIAKNKNIIHNIMTLLKFTTRVAIIFGFTAPLICNIIFGSNVKSIYLTMLSFMLIFLPIYNITFDNIKNKKIIYASLVIGIISKIILIVPLINSFYRMGYNLIYGDIISTCLSMFISIIINYIYLKSKNKKEKTLDKIFSLLSESITLSIIFVILQFIMPLSTKSYIKSILLFAIYIFISITFLKFKKKRG